MGKMKHSSLTLVEIEAAISAAKIPRPRHQKESRRTMKHSSLTLAEIEAAINAAKTPSPRHQKESRRTMKHFALILGEIEVVAMARRSAGVSGKATRGMRMKHLTSILVEIGAAILMERNMERRRSKMTSHLSWIKAVIAARIYMSTTPRKGKRAGRSRAKMRTLSLIKAAIEVVIRRGSKKRRRINART